MTANHLVKLQDCPAQGGKLKDLAQKVAADYYLDKELFCLLPRKIALEVQDLKDKQYELLGIPVAGGEYFVFNHRTCYDCRIGFESKLVQAACRDCLLAKEINDKQQYFLGLAMNTLSLDANKAKN